ncbi:MAG: hypothetical protein ACK45I_07965 [Bacteroidota bacterium]|jgi:hypothetical protein
MKRILIIGLFSCSQVMAQVPGYMGKLVSIGYRADISPRIVDEFYSFGVPVNYNGGEVKLYNVALTHNLDAELVLARQLSFRFMYGLSNNGAFAYSTSPSGYDGEPVFLESEFPKLSSQFDRENSGYGGNNTDVRDYDYVRTSSRMLRYGLSFSRGFYFAPHGKTTTVYFLQNATTAEAVLNGTPKSFVTVRSYGLMLERTNRKIIADAILLEYGLSIGYLFGGQLSEMYNAPTAASYFTGLDNKRIMFQLSLGIRYLLPKFTR